VRGDDDSSWHDQQPVILAAGVAGLLLLALLVWAVIHTANWSTRPPDPVEFAPSSATSSTYTTESTSSTSYSVPSVQTSQDNPVVTGPPESTADAPGVPRRRPTPRPPTRTRRRRQPTPATAKRWSVGGAADRIQQSMRSTTALRLKVRHLVLDDRVEAEPLAVCHS